MNLNNFLSGPMHGVFPPHVKCQALINVVGEEAEGVVQSCSLRALNSVAESLRIWPVTA